MDAPWETTDWEDLLTEELACPVRVSYGRSRTVPVHAQGLKIGGRPGLKIRLHRMFSGAPLEIRDDLARWLRVGKRARKACDRLDKWIQATVAGLPPRPSVSTCPVSAE